MKQQTPLEYAKKIDKIEKDLIQLKRGSTFQFPKASISLRGILKGIEITNQDIQAAKKSLFKKIIF